MNEIGARRIGGEFILRPDLESMFLGCPVLPFAKFWQFSWARDGGLAPGFSVPMVGKVGVLPKDSHFGLKEGVAFLDEGGVEVGAFVEAGEDGDCVLTEEEVRDVAAVQIDAFGGQDHGFCFV